ncbi:hypothetical protein PAEVO_35030 [Paenibacillus sp. GM2FR]|nr:hypothetical protein PAEVO_35030 [Paenibacillus sp. GM2FR]
MAVTDGSMNQFLQVLQILQFLQFLQILKVLQYPETNVSYTKRTSDTLFRKKQPL